MKRQEIEVVCYGLKPSKPEIVFSDEKHAHSCSGGDFRRLDVSGNEYFVPEYAIYRPGRTIAELMYFCLFDMESVVTTQDIMVELHEEGRFIHNMRLADSIKRSHNPLVKMPRLIQLYAAVKELGLFEEHPYKIDGNIVRPLAIFLNRILSWNMQPLSNPDNYLERLILEHNTGKEKRF